MSLIAFGLVVAYNPLYLYYLMSNGALGGMSVHAVTGGVFLTCAIGYKAILLLSGKIIRIRRSSILNIMTLLFLVFCGGVLTGLANANERVVFVLDAFPLLEMFCIYYLIRLTPGMNINLEKIVKWLAGYIFIMCVSDLLSYCYLTYVKQINFAALRANIAGVVVNRLMDFVVPLFGPSLIVLTRNSKSKTIRIFLPILVLLTVGLTFYRTVYAAFFAATGVILIQKKQNILFFSKAIIVSMAIGTIILFATHTPQTDSEFDMTELMAERVKSIFDSGEEDSSIGSRHEQAKLMFAEVPQNPFLGKGFGGAVESGPVKYTSNYFLQVLLLLGIPGAILFIWLFIKVGRVLSSLSKTATEQKEKAFFTGMASVLAGIAAVLYFFPYTMYFPLHYLLGAIAGLADICFLRRNTQFLALKAANENN